MNNLPNPDIAALSRQIAQLTARLNKLETSSSYTFQKDIQVLDGRNLKFGGTKGTKIGQATAKLAFFGASPVAQPSGISDPSGGTTIDAAARTAINSIITALANLGLIA